MKCISPLCLLAILRNTFSLCSKYLSPTFIIFLIESLVTSIIFLSMIGSWILLWVALVLFKLFTPILKKESTIDKLVSARNRTYMPGKGKHIFKKLFKASKKVDIIILNILLYINIPKTTNVLFCTPHKID